MPKVYYYIVALWDDEDGFYPSEEDDFYFPPTVQLLVAQPGQALRYEKAFDLELFYDEESKYFPIEC